MSRIPEIYWSGGKPYFLHGIIQDPRQGKELARKYKCKYFWVKVYNTRRNKNEYLCYLTRKIGNY